MRQPFFLALLGIAAAIWIWQYRAWRLPEVPASTIEQIAAFEDAMVFSQVKDATHAIDKPVFESVYDADQYLDADGWGLDVEMFGTHRFYPYQVLSQHGVVNDVFYNKPILIAFSPLCFSGHVFLRGEQDVTEGFGVSGRVWNNQSVLYDRETDSLWLPISGRAVVGKRAVEDMTRYPSRPMTWKEWRGAFPQGAVLSARTGFDLDYTQDPYRDYYTNHEIRFPILHMDTSRSAKEMVTDGDVTAFSMCSP